MPLKHSIKPSQLRDAWKKTASALPVKIANTALNFFLDGFRKQAWQGDNGNEPWKERAPGAERNQGRAILVDRGVLKRSLTKYVERNRVRVMVTGPAEKYAAIHNMGGVTHPRVTPAMRGHFLRLYKLTGNKRYLWIATTKKDKLTVNIPRRHYIGNSKQLNRKLDQLFIREMNKTFNSK